MADNFTLEQQQAIALAEAERRKAEDKGSASWGDVLTQAPLKAVTGVIDEIKNAPQNLYNIGQTAAELGNAAFGPGNVNVYGGQLPADQGDMTIPDNTAQNFMQEQGFIDPTLRGRMTPGQKVADTAVQGAVGGLFAGGEGATAVAKNSLVGGLSNAAGETVTQGTGSEALGLTTSMLSPVGASKIASLNKLREETKALNAVRDKTLADAQDLGFVVVPEDRVAQFADRKKLLDAAVGINQRKTNDVARNVLGINPTTPLTTKVLDDLNKRVYQKGYEPLKKLGSVTTDNNYIDDLIKIEQEYTGAAGSFPDDVPPKLRELVDAYLVPDFDAKDVVDKIRVLRRRATKNINSDDPTNNEYGFAQKKIAEAMEAQLEREITRVGANPALIDTYREARKIIATSHTVESALNSASGDVDIKKLARQFEKGDYMEGDLLKVAKFGSINKPKNLDRDKIPYSHLAGAGAGMAVAGALDLPWWTGGALASAGAIAAKETHSALAAPIREYLMSKTGQKRASPNYDGLGIDARSGPLSGMMFENAQGAQ